jgi:hypothetical protein
VSSFRLDRFTSQDEANARKRRLRQIDCEKIEGAFAAQDAINAELANQLAQILQAQADATAAGREVARINSYTSPGSVLTATDAGSDATITIASHSRIYPVQGSITVPPVSINGDSETGLAYSTRYWVYYDDETLADTDPAFVVTTTAADAQVGAASGRHALGYIDTPASGGSPTGGSGTAPPGGTGGGGGDGTVLP